MSILNRPSDGIVSVLVALVRSSVMLGTMPKSKLLDICCPKTLGDGKQDMAIKTLNRWTELGLFVVTEKEDVKVNDEYRASIRKLERIGPLRFQMLLDRSCSRRRTIRIFGAMKKTDQRIFSRAACWILAQDVHAFVPTSYTQVEPKALEQAGSPEVILFQNDTRWSGFVSWATFLGLGRSDSGKATGGFIADPTPWICGPASTLLPPKNDMPIREFLDGLAEAVPILDGGRFRAEVESKLRPEKWKHQTATRFRHPFLGIATTSSERHPSF